MTLSLVAGLSKSEFLDSTPKTINKVIDGFMRWNRLLSGDKDAFLDDDEYNANLVKKKIQQIKKEHKNGRS